MRSVITFCFLFCLLSITASAQQSTHPFRFKISGVCTGFSDSTLLYLSDLAENTYNDIDSTYMINGRFQFTGTLKNNLERFGIHTKGFKDRVSFWIDETETQIVAEKDKFRAARISGSKAQAEQYELDSVSNLTNHTKPVYIHFIQQNPTSIVSANLLNIFSASWNKDTVTMLYNQLSGIAKESRYGKNILEFLTINKSPGIGDSFIDFAQPNVNGQNIKLSDYSGKIILLDFWGSWCLPCRQEHPALIKLYNMYKDKGFEIFGVAAETDKKVWMDALEKDGLPWPNVTELKGDRNKAALIYGINKYPSNFLIDGNGIIIAQDLRGNKLAEKLKLLFE